MKIFNTVQMKQLDLMTMKSQGLSSWQLMERAGRQLTVQILKDYQHQNNFVVCCGKGNNGGDGLVISRLLQLQGKKVVTIIPKDLTNVSVDFLINIKKLEDLPGIELRHYPCKMDDLQEWLLIDALFGSGLNKPLSNEWLAWVHDINRFKKVVAVDINSGLPSTPDLAMHAADYTAVVSQITYCIDSPKLSLLMADFGSVCEQLKIVDIGLDPDCKQQTDVNFYTIDEDVLYTKPQRKRFDYKNKLGHLLVHAGSAGKCGAAYLCGKAALKTGCGLVSYATDNYCADKLQILLPEAMIAAFLPEAIVDVSQFDVLAAGPGLGKSVTAKNNLTTLLKLWNKPMVLDADALNILSEKSDHIWQNNAIITPHVGEFDRLTQKHNSAFDRLQTQIKYSVQNQIIIVLKGAYTSVSMPDGKVYFCMNGTPAMAKAGSGDVLTGIIASLLCQHVNPEKAACLGVYIHARAGEIAAEEFGLNSPVASDIINNIHNVI